MRSLALALTPALTLFVSSPLGAQLAEDAIEAAIAAGLSQQVPGVIDVGSTDAGRFSVRLAGPLGRVASAAALARRDGEPFARAQVTDAMLGPTIQVTAYPNDPDFRLGRTVSTPAAERVVLEHRQGRTRRLPIEPVTSATFSLRWGNTLGAIVEGQGITADFERAGLPEGEFEIVVRTARGDQRYRVRPADLEQVR